MRGRRGLVLVSVMVLTVVTWALLATILTTAFLHDRLALGAERGAVAGAAAEHAVSAALSAARAVHGVDGAWPAANMAADDGACILELVEAEQADAWYRVRVRAEFEGAVAWREGTVHAAP